MDETLLRILIFLFGVLLGMEVGGIIVRNRITTFLNKWISELKRVAEENKK